MSDLCIWINVRPIVDTEFDPGDTVMPVKIQYYNGDVATVQFSFESSGLTGDYRNVIFDLDEIDRAISTLKTLRERK